ncbi:hypothetical protein EJA72_17280 [Pseudomonas sp. PB120]|nr:hypothetical protein [Pseudomonas sp. PB120]
MRRRFPSTCIASRSAKARGCRRRFWGWRRKWPLRRSLWRGSLLPLGSEAAPKNGPAAQSSGSKLPRHRFSIDTTIYPNPNPRIPLSAVFALLPHDGRITSLGWPSSA